MTDNDLRQDAADRQDVLPPPRRSLIRRIVRIAVRAVAGLVAVILLIVAGVLVLINVPYGRHLIEQKTSDLTGRTVLLKGLSGRLPYRLHLDSLVLRDPRGAWLTIDDFDLNWSPLRLLFGTAHVDFVRFGHLSIPRLPESSDADTSSSSSSSSTNLPLRKIVLGHVDAGRIDVGAPVAGIPAAFSLTGHAEVIDPNRILNGLSFDRLPSSNIALDLKRLDEEGHIVLGMVTARKKLNLHLKANEGKSGFAAKLTGMPDLTPLDLALDMKGPVSKEALVFLAHAGPIVASIKGEMNLPAQTSSIDINASAPAMSPGNGIAWQSMMLAGHLGGKFSAPVGECTLTADALTAANVSMNALEAKFTGTDHAENRMGLHARITGLTLPGSAATLLASDPVVLDATYAPLAADKPVTLRVSHPLLSLDAKARTAPDLSLHTVLDLPELKPFVALSGQVLSGHTHLTADIERAEKENAPIVLSLDGNIAALKGLPQAVGLIGTDGKLHLNASLTPTVDAGKNVTGQTLDLGLLELTGKALKLSASGKGFLPTAGKVPLTGLDMTAALALPDLKAVQPSVTGGAKLDVRATGDADNLSVTTHVEADPATASLKRSPLQLDAVLQGLPSTPKGKVTAQGQLDGYPLSLDLSLEQQPDGMNLALNTLKWQSLQGTAALRLPTGQVVPLGQLDLSMKRLADLSHIVGQSVSGSLVASVKTTVVPVAGKADDKESNPTVPRVDVKFDGHLGAGSISASRLNLSGAVIDPAGNMNADLKLLVDRLVAPSVKGDLKVSVKGPQQALAVGAQGQFRDLAGAPGSLDLNTVLDLKQMQAHVSRLVAIARGETLRLKQASLLSFGETMGVDRLQATLGPAGATPAVIDLAGTVKPALKLTAKIDHLTPALAAPFAPSLKAEGIVTANAQLAGTIDKPTGRIEVNGRGLRMITGDAASLPPMKLDFRADLAGSQAALEGEASAGKNFGLHVRGKAPLSKDGALDLKTDGHVDLGIANGVLGAAGRQANGAVAFDIALTGTASAPHASGRATLRDGSFEDFTKGVQLKNMTADVLASGGDVIIQNFRAQAGEGTIDLAGKVGVFVPGMPVNMHLTAQKARPISSDLVTALINADIAVQGQLKSRIDVDGKIDLPRVEINIPNSMPSSVATLDVIRPGEKAPAVSEHVQNLIIGLNLVLRSPGSFFVRGHGLDAEMGGLLKVSGNSTAPLLSGGFNLKRGFFDLAGVSLNFTKGRVGFDGSGVQHSLDPTLDFEADRYVAGKTAMLKIGGYASSPKISFESLPPLPQDEVMSMLLFGQEASTLTSTQMAELGAALVTLAGGSSFDPLGTVRKTLGLDRLAIGGGSGVGNGGSSIEAGRYVMKGVYVGAKQSTSGSGTQAQAQIDLTKHLKLNTTVGTGGTVTGFTTPENDPGSSVGLLWQYRY